MMDFSALGRVPEIAQSIDTALRDIDSRLESIEGLLRVQTILMILDGGDTPLTDDSIRHALNHLQDVTGALYQYRHSLLDDFPDPRPGHPPHRAGMNDGKDAV